MILRFTIFAILNLQFIAFGNADCTGPDGKTGQVQWISPNLRVCNANAWHIITPGTAGIGCAPAAAGTFNFNGTAYEYCNGSSIFSLPGTPVGACGGRPLGALWFDHPTADLFFCGPLDSGQRLFAGTPDPCSGTPAMGTVCSSGAIFFGPIAGAPAGNYMLMPGGCADDTSDPVCTPGPDVVTRVWSTGYITTGAQDVFSGEANLATLTSLDPSLSVYNAAKYCEDMVYGGYSDWFLPSVAELQELRANRPALEGGSKGSFSGTDNTKRHWTSHENTTINNTQYGSYYIMYGSSGYGAGGKTSSYYVRCVRRQP